MSLTPALPLFFIKTYGILHGRNAPARTREEQKMKIPKELKRAANMKAHAAGLAHAEQIKLRLMDDIARRMDEGESIASITEYLAARNAIVPFKPSR